MQVSKQKVDLVLPADLKEASADLLSLCELFIGCLLGSQAETTDIKVDLPRRLVSSSDGKLREMVCLFVGANKIEGFASQLISLLHRSTDPSLLGVLLCTVDGKAKGLVFQKIGESYIDWRITVEA